MEDVPFAHFVYKMLVANSTSLLSMPYLLYIYSSMSLYTDCVLFSIQIHGVLYTLNFFVTMFDIIRRNLYPSFEIYTTLHEPRLSEIHTKAKSALVENILSFLKPKKKILFIILFG